MSETDEEVTLSGENPTVDEPQNEDPNTNPAPGVEAPAEDFEAQLAAAQAELQQLRSENEELTPLAQAAREAEEAQKSELQKLQESQAERDQKITTLESENSRLRLAQAYGLAEEDLPLLGNGSSEEMEANAKRLQDLHANAMQVEDVPSVRPVDSMKPGSSQKKSAEDAAYPAHWAV